MYEVELSEAAITDLDDFSLGALDQIFAFLLSLSDQPKPVGVQVIPLLEAADGLAYLYDTDTFSIYYNIFETARVAKVVGIFKRFNLN